MLKYGLSTTFRGRELTNGGSSLMKRYEVPPTSIGMFSEPDRPMRLIRYTYFAFVFSIPFEAADIGIGSGGFTLSRLVGYMLVMVALLQPSLCFRRPPKALWYFVAYLYILMLMIFWHGLESQQMAIGRLVTLSQLLVIFWISYNLMKHEYMRMGTLAVLAISCTFLAVLLTLHIVSGSSSDATSMSTSMVGTSAKLKGRVTAFGANPNSIASILSLGLLALVGLVFGRERMNIKARLLAWPCLGVLVIAIVRTGSRGAIVAIMAGLSIFLLKGRGISPWLKSWVKRSRLKIGLAVVGVVGFVIVFSYQYEPVRVRWEATLTEGRFAGREKIYPEALGMFLEKPWFGWGPATHYLELGARLGVPERDPHNVYLWIVLETGLMGALPFFAGLWVCWRRAWKACSSYSALPAALLATVLTIAMKGTTHRHKLFWVVLAYALVSGSVIALPKLRTAARSSGQAAARLFQRRVRPTFTTSVPRLPGGPLSS